MALEGKRAGKEEVHERGGQQELVKRALRP